MNRKPIRKVSKRQQERLREYARVRLAYLKEHPWCEICKDTMGLFENARDIHHRYGTVGPLLTDTWTFLAVCRFHHRYIHDNIATSRKMGWICEKGYWNNIKAVNKLKENK
jgi:hypothetical protein